MLARQNIIFGVCFIAIIGEINSNYNSSCGIDKSPIDIVYEGVAKIETYPWLGYLIYRSGKSDYSTTVVLVTKQIVIGTASDINLIPKHDFRARARVVLGNKCPYPGIPVRDYVYHPDYIKRTHSALALIQLDLDLVRQELTPICPPPSFFVESEFYAMTLTPDCKKPVVQIYEMEHVDPVQCQLYYRKSGLDLQALWPTHTACGKARYGGECLWRGGTVLALKQAGRWRLVGVGIYGPGCEAPSRFLDYGMYRGWITNSILRVGKPAVTRMGPNHVILRRRLANVQRYGPCDQEEKLYELYTEETIVKPGKDNLNIAKFNMTVVANTEYSCVVFRAESFLKTDKVPILRLRRWCASNPPTCTAVQHIQIDFYVEIKFTARLRFTMRAYGQEAMAIDKLRAMKYINRPIVRPHIMTPDEVKNALRAIRRLKENHDVGWAIIR